MRLTTAGLLSFSGGVVIALLLPSGWLDTAAPFLNLAPAAAVVFALLYHLTRHRRSSP